MHIKKYFLEMKIALNCKNPQMSLAIKVTELAILYDFNIFFNNLKLIFITLSKSHILKFF